MTLEPATREAMIAAIPGLRAFARSLCKNADHADDLVQDALLRACTKIALFRPDSSMSAWLLAILRNCFYSEFRKRRGTMEPYEDHVETLGVEPAQHARTDYHDLRTALDRLPAEQREAVILVGASGLSYEQAAKICGCAEGTVKSRVNRGRARLAELMGLERPHVAVSERPSERPSARPRAMGAISNLAAA